MTNKKRYRYGKWTRNTRLRITDEPHDTPGPWFRPWQRTRWQVVTNDTGWPFGEGVGPAEIEYGTDEEVAHTTLRERFGG